MCIWILVCVRVCGRYKFNSKQTNKKHWKMLKMQSDLSFNVLFNVLNTRQMAVLSNGELDFSFHMPLYFYSCHFMIEFVGYSCRPIPLCWTIRECKRVKFVGDAKGECVRRKQYCMVLLREFLFYCAYRKCHQIFMGEKDDFSICVIYYLLTNSGLNWCTWNIL